MMTTQTKQPHAIASEDFCQMVANVSNGKIALIDALEIIDHLEDQKLAESIKLFIYESIEKKFSEKESLERLKQQQLCTQNGFFNVYN